MKARTTRTLGNALLVAAAVLAVADSAGAIFIATPLRISASSGHVDVGDDVGFDIEPLNESEARTWAGKRISIVYGYDAGSGDGGSSPDGATDSSAWREGSLLDDLTLDDGARASFRWTVPEDVRDRNVVVTARSESGETLALVHVRVGNAPEVMYALGAPDGSGGLEAASGPGEPSEGSRKDVPAAGLVAVLATGAAAVLASRRR